MDDETEVDGEKIAVAMQRLLEKEAPENGALLIEDDGVEISHTFAKDTYESHLAEGMDPGKAVVKTVDGLLELAEAREDDDAEGTET